MNWGDHSRPTHPLLDGFGYAPSTANAPRALFTLAAVYALLPCILKACAALALLVSPFFRPEASP